MRAERAAGEAGDSTAEGTPLWVDGPGLRAGPRSAGHWKQHRVWSSCGALALGSGAHGGHVDPSPAAGGSLRSLISLRKRLLLANPEDIHAPCMQHPFLGPSGGAVSPARHFSAPAVHLPPRSSVIRPDFSSLSRTRAPDSASPARPLYPIRLPPAARGFLCSGCTPISLAELRRACNSASESSTFCFVIRWRERERTRAQMNCFLQTYCN